MSIIDTGKLEAWIVKIEALFAKENLTQHEQLLILQQVTARITKRVQKTKSKDLLNDMLPSFAKNFLKGEAQKDGTG